MGSAWSFRQDQRALISIPRWCNGLAQSTLDALVHVRIVGGEPSRFLLTFSMAYGIFMIIYLKIYGRLTG